MTEVSTPGQSATQSASGDSATTSGAAAAQRTIGRRRDDRLVGASESNQRTIEQAIAAARSNKVVLVAGPDGAGKVHTARAIHAWSARVQAPFVVFHAAATPAADQARALLGPDAEAAVARAGAGTLVISRADALGDALLQSLLRGLTTGSCDIPGGGQVALQARIILTSADRDSLRVGGLSLDEVIVDSLSARREDIAPLAVHFLVTFAEDGGVAPVGFTNDARTWLLEEAWGGNVRELRERVRQALTLAGDGAISAEALMLSGNGEEVPSFKEAKRAFETRYVEGLLRRCGGNISRAARLAKKDRKDFYDVIRRTGVSPAEFRH